MANVWKGSFEPQDEQVRVLMQLCDSSSDERVRVRCVGTLECLAQYPTAIEQNKVCVILSVGLSLLRTCSDIFIVWSTRASLRI